jgi:GT2 family glycosyltransferase
VDSIHISVVLVFHNQRELAEQVLSTLYNPIPDNIKLFIIDNASIDDTAESIKSVVDFYGHEETYFIEMETKLPTEEILAEVYPLLETPLFWVPLIDAETTLESLFADVNWTQISGFSRNMRDLGQALSKTDDNSRFINPHKEPTKKPLKKDSEELPDSLSKYFGAFSEDSSAKEDSNASDVTSTKEDSSATEVSKIHPLSPRGNPRSLNFFDGLESNAITQIKPRVEAFLAEGEYPLALRAIDEALKRNLDDTALIHVKIRLLERMRRFVEAAELKHKLKLGGLGAPAKVVRGQAGIVVDPSEDDHRVATVDEQESSFKFPTVPVEKSDITEEIEELPTELESQAASELTSELESPTKPESQTDSELTSEFDTTSELESQTDSELTSELESTTEPESQTDSDLKSEFDSTTESESEPYQNIEENESEKTQEKEKARGAQFDSNVRISIIIPTCSDGKSLLENALVALSKYSALPDRELIVVDNASLDETYLYLEQLRKEHFMQIRVLTQSENLGFAKSINQALEIARGEYILLMHNDVTFLDDVPGSLANLMDANRNIEILGPVTNITNNDLQRAKKAHLNKGQLQSAEHLDSFCMMFRKKSGLRFDDRYELAFFDDVDFCNTAQQNGKEMAIAEGVFVEHLGGATTGSLGLSFLGKSYWKNFAKFNEKWNKSTKLPDYVEDVSPISQLITISEIINPYFPEPHLVKASFNILTSEVRNEIVNTRHTYNNLTALIRLMLIIDMRDVLRELENQLNPSTIEESLIYELVDFYYRKHIYSRCHKYLGHLSASQTTFPFKLLELRILMGDKKIDEASELVNALLEQAPTHPELFKITADIHKLYGNKAEAARFYALAHQVNPYSYNERREFTF